MKANIGTQPTAVSAVTHAGLLCWVGRSYREEVSSSAPLAVVKESHRGRPARRRLIATIRMPIRRPTCLPSPDMAGSNTTCPSRRAQDLPPCHHCWLHLPQLPPLLASLLAVRAGGIVRVVAVALQLDRKVLHSSLDGGRIATVRALYGQPFCSFKAKENCRKLLFYESYFINDRSDSRRYVRSNSCFARNLEPEKSGYSDGAEQEKTIRLTRKIKTDPLHPLFSRNVARVPVINCETRKMERKQSP